MGICYLAAMHVSTKEMNWFTTSANNAHKGEKGIANMAGCSTENTIT